MKKASRFKNLIHSILLSSLLYLIGAFIIFNSVPVVLCQSISSSDLVSIPQSPEAHAFQEYGNTQLLMNWLGDLDKYLK